MDISDMSLKHEEHLPLILKFIVFIVLPYSSGPSLRYLAVSYHTADIFFTFSVATRKKYCD